MLLVPWLAPPRGAKPNKAHGAFVEVPYFLSKYDLRSRCAALLSESDGTHNKTFRAPLVKKLDESVVEEEYARLEG